VTGDKKGRTWRNWARTEEAEPVGRVVPRDVAGVVDAVLAAVRDGQGVTVAGAGHSASAIGRPAGVLLDVGRLDRVRRVDTLRGLVTVEAGLPLYRLSDWLWRAGLALSNLGDIDRQTVGGAVSTGTHGTGLGYGSLSEQVRELELVLADGSVVTCSPSAHPDLFQAARVGLGAFGVLTAVTLHCVPAYPIRAVERRVPLEEAVRALAEPRGPGEGFEPDGDHREFYWFPHTQRALLKSAHRLAPGTGFTPRPAWRELWEDEVVNNALLGLVTRTSATVRPLIRPVNRLCTTLMGERGWTDRSYRVLASRRRMMFREAEFGVPLAALPDVLARLRDWLERPGHEIGFPVEVRNGPAEEGWLSMAYGRATAWVSVQTRWHQPYAALVEAITRICAEHGGRPHWGKLHQLDAAALAGRYPRFADARAVRDRVDPQRRFTNEYVARVLGS
jgi:L-gulonolactone oxidase